MILDLRKGLGETDQYKAWKFPGGELHFKLDQRVIDLLYVYNLPINIIVRLNSSDDIMFMLLVIDTLKKDFKDKKITLTIPYMPYQQADRNFGVGECFSLKTVCNIINSMELDKVMLYFPHSDVSGALLNNCEIIDNSTFISEVLDDINSNDEDLVVISPDSGAYKLIFKLCEKLNIKSEIITCSKARNHETGVITTVVPLFDVNKKVLIIDDIALGSRTFLKIRKEISNENVYLAVSHGIFNDNVDLLEKEFKKIYTTNSRRDVSISENIKVIKVF